MEITPLGLPLQYSQLSQYFDILDAGDDDAKNHFIETKLKEHKVETVLDLTCGTGSQLLWLAQHGYQVTGADISPSLLEIAKNKAHNQNLDIPLLHGDMRSIQVGKFDAVITIFNAIGHLTKEDFEQAIKNIHGNLKADGVYIFDIFNLQAMHDGRVAELAMDNYKTINDTSIRNVQYSELNRTNGHLTSYDEFTIQVGNTPPKTLNSHFTLQIYTAEELRDMLSSNGFDTIEQCSLDGSRLIEDDTINILTIAKKQS